MLGFILGTKSYASSITSNESVEETPCEINTRLDKELKTINKAFNSLSNRKFEDIHDLENYVDNKQIKKESSKSKKVKTIWKPW